MYVKVRQACQILGLWLQITHDPQQLEAGLTFWYSIQVWNKPMHSQARSNKPG